MTPRRPPHRRRRTPPQRWWRGRVLTRYGRQALSILVVAATLFLRERGPAVPVAKRDEDGPPAIWAVDTRGDSWWGMSSPARDVPATPFPKQKRPPCTPRVEEEILGGCWTLLGAVAPCPQDTFEHSGRCYIPTKLAPRPATSIED